MSNIKQKICEKIGVSEASIKNNKIFSSENKSKFSQPSVDYKQANLSTLTSTGKSNQSNKSMSCFEHHKMDILVPNAQPPTPQIRALKTESYSVFNSECRPKKQIDLDKKLAIFSPSKGIKKSLTGNFENKKSNNAF